MSRSEGDREAEASGTDTTGVQERTPQTQAGTAPGARPSGTVEAPTPLQPPSADGAAPPTDGPSPAHGFATPPQDTAGAPPAGPTHPRPGWSSQSPSWHAAPSQRMAPLATVAAPAPRDFCAPTSADNRPRGRPRRRRDPSHVTGVAAAVHAAVKQQPGIHFRALARAAGVTSAGQLRHHLDRLARQGLLSEVQDGGYKRFFATGEHEPSLRPGLARFSRSIPRRIGQLLLAGPLNRTELRRRLGCADSTLGYHLNRMLLTGDLRRRRSRCGCEYTLADGEFVRRILVVQPGVPARSPPEPNAGPVPVTDRMPTARAEAGPGLQA